MTSKTGFLSVEERPRHRGLIRCAQHELPAYAVPDSAPDNCWNASPLKFGVGQLKTDWKMNNDQTFRFHLIFNSQEDAKDFDFNAQKQSLTTEIVEDNASRKWICFASLTVDTSKTDFERIRGYLKTLSEAFDGTVHGYEKVQDK